MDCLKDEISQLKYENSATVEQLSLMNEKIIEQKNKLLEANTDSKDSKEQTNNYVVNNLQIEIKELNNQIDDLKDRQKKLAKEIDDKNTIIYEKNQNLNLMGKQIEELMEQVDEKTQNNVRQSLKNLVDKDSDDEIDLDSEIKAIDRKDRQTSKLKNMALEDEAELLRNELEKSENYVSRLRLEIAELKSQLEEAQQSQRESTGAFKLDSNLLNMRSSEMLYAFRQINSEMDKKEQEILSDPEKLNQFVEENQIRGESDKVEKVVQTIVEKVVEVIVEKPVYVEVPVEVKVIVEVPVYVDKPAEIVYSDKVIEKPVMDEAQKKDIEERLLQYYQPIINDLSHELERTKMNLSFATSELEGLQSQQKAEPFQDSQETIDKLNQEKLQLLKNIDELQDELESLKQLRVVKGSSIKEGIRISAAGDERQEPGFLPQVSMKGEERIIEQAVVEPENRETNPSEKGPKLRPELVSSQKEMAALNSEFAIVQEGLRRLKVAEAELKKKMEETRAQIDVHGNNMTPESLGMVEKLYAESEIQMESFEQLSKEIKVMKTKENQLKVELVRVLAEMEKIERLRFQDEIHQEQQLETKEEEKPQVMRIKKKENMKEGLSNTRSYVENLNLKGGKGSKVLPAVPGMKKQGEDFVKYLIAKKGRISMTSWTCVGIRTWAK